jgi:hypothetical protein
MKPDPLFESFLPEIIGVHGRIGVGKTFLAATLSQFWPRSLAERKTATKKIMLEDCYWFEVDSNATAGFSVLGIDTPKLSMQALRGSKKAWEGAGFKMRPTVIEVMDLYQRTLVKRCADGQTHFGIVDTVSTLDASMVTYHRMIVDRERSPNEKENKYALWQRNFVAHQIFTDALKYSGAYCVIYLMHSRAKEQEAGNEAAKKKNMSALIFGDAEIDPAVTGQSAGLYKRDPTMQLYCTAKRVPGKQGHDSLVRGVYTDFNLAGSECKNRYGEVLLLEEKPNLRDMFTKIRAAQRKWK